MAISALVSLLLAKKRVNSPAILFRTRTIASAFQSEARVRCTLRPDDTSGEGSNCSLESVCFYLGTGSRPSG